MTALHYCMLSVAFTLVWIVAAEDVGEVTSWWSVHMSGERYRRCGFEII